MKKRPLRAKVAIILINYKDYAEKYLDECYKSLLEQSYPQELFKIFIVDNASTKESLSTIKKVAPEVEILTNKGNLGWGGGNNTGIKAAQKEDFDYFVMLNMDTALDKNWLKYLVEKANANNDLSIIQSQVIIYDTDKINTFGNSIQFLGYGLNNCYGDRVGSTKGKKIHMDYASGSSMLIKGAVFEKIGLFKEEYFMYHDDLEFCLRARVAGFRVGIAEKSLCYHKYVFNSPDTHIYFLERNRLLVLFTLLELPTILIILPCLIFFELGMTFYFIIKGWGRQRIKIFGYFTKRNTWKYIKKERLKIKKIREIKDQNIAKGFVGSVDFSEIDNPILRYFLNPLLNIYWTIFKRLIFW